jgi:hypothetical protein
VALRADAVRPGPALHINEAGPPDAPLVVLVHGALDRSAGFAKVARRLDAITASSAMTAAATGARDTVPGRTQPPSTSPTFSNS